MTQQDDTGRGTATEQQPPLPGETQPAQAQPVPAGPSPYLAAGESIPQAYLAPPQPGQPSYGTPPGYGTAQRSLGSARQAFGQSGYGQPGRGQSGYGPPGSRQRGSRPAGARGAFGPQSRRDPAIAAPWERLVASVIDWVIIFAASVLAFISPLLRIWHELQAITGQYGNLSSPAAQAAIDSISRDPSNQHALLYWFLGMFGIAFCYYWVQHAAWGATVGKRALGMRVVNAADRSSVGIRAAGLRTVLFLIGPAMFLLLPSPVNIIGGVLWLADTVTPLFDARGRCLHDRLAGTIVVRQRWLNQQARASSPW